MKRRIVALAILLGGVLLIAAQCPFPIPDPPDQDPDPTPGTVLFFDDFGDGHAPQWDMTPGWESGGGMLRHSSGNSWAYVGHGADWTDYQVDLDLDLRTESVGIIIRCQEDLQNYLQLYGGKEALRFVTVVDAVEVTDTGWLYPGFFDGEQHVRIVADGSVIRIYINENLRMTIEDVPFLAGMPGLHAYYGGNEVDCARFDNFRVTALD